MNWDKLREWLQTAGLVAIPIMVTCMGNKVATSNATRETDALYAQTAVGILAAPVTDANRALRPWATKVLAHYSPVPFTDTVEATLSQYRLVLRALLGSPVPPLSRIIVWPASVTLLPAGQATFSAVGFNATGDTVPISDLTWTASGGSIFESDNDGGRYYARFMAGTAAGDFVVTAHSASRGLADSAFVHIRPR